MEETADREGTAFEAAAAEALRTVDEVRGLLESASSGDLADKAALVGERLEAAREALKTAAGDKVESLGRVIAGAEQSVREELDEVDQLIRSSPRSAVLAAAAVGFLLGLALSGRR